MQFELILSNQPSSLPTVHAFTHTTLRQLPLAAEQADALAEYVARATQGAIEHAYAAGEEGEIRVSIAARAGKLEIRVRDFGLPVDGARLERQLHEQAALTAGGVELPGGLVDEAHWLAFGPQGKALQLIKWLPSEHIAAQAERDKLAPFHDDAPLAPEQEYVVRPLRPDDAVQVSQLMYRAYGNSYFNADVYYPERIVAENASGALRSLVAAAADGAIAGVYALEFNDDGPVAEFGQAVVDPAHRGRGLLERMKALAIDEAQARQLVGWYADAVAVHVFTQKSNVTHGGRLSSVSLGISPRTERFKGIADEQPQRVTCLLYFHWLQTPQRRTVYAPPRHREMLAAIYVNLQCPVEFADGRVAGAAPHGELTVKCDTGGARATVRVERSGEDTLASIRHAKRRLIERSRAEAVFVELPLADPATPALAEALSADGFGFTGVLPHFSPAGDLLRLAYLVDPLAREPIKTYEPFAGQLVDYALGDQERVQGL